MFAKLFSSITESSLWSEPKETRLLFVTLLAKADETGFVEASIPGLARVANLTLEETKQALDCLQAPDEYSKNPDNEGRRIAVVPGGFVLLNYEDYRSRRNTEERREYMRQYMRQYRQKPVLADVNSGKPPLAHTDTDTETEEKAKVSVRSKTQYDPVFLSFWEVYPNKNDKKKAAKAWKAALKDATPESIINGAKQYAEIKRKDPTFIKNAATWLNDGSWENEYEQAQPAKKAGWMAREMAAKRRNGEITLEQFNKWVQTQQARTDD